MNCSLPKSRFAPFTVALLTAVTLFVGCTSKPYDVAKVAGRVTLDGEPIENGSVRFQPQRSSGEHPIVGPGSIGQTDADGRFELMTYKGDSGAVVGVHKVSISTYAVELVDPDKSDDIRVTSKERIPKRYRSPTELTITVPDSGLEDATFALTTQ